MKKLIILCVLVSLLLTIAGCGKKENEKMNSEVIEDIGSVDKNYKAYYINESDSTISGFNYNFDAESVDELVNNCVNLFKSTPIEPGVLPVLPDGVVIKDYSYNETNKSVTLDFNSAYRDIPTVREVLSRAVIVKTLTQFDGIINYVVFFVDGELLLDNKGKGVVMMASDLVENTMADIKDINEDTFILYFATSDNLELYANEFYVHYYSSYSKERVIVEGIIAGPINATLNATVSSDTMINKISTTDGLCTVDFNSVFLASIDNQSFAIKVYSIVNSLCQLDNVDRVKIIINGAESDYSEDGISLKNEFTENPNLVMKNAGTQQVEIDTIDDNKTSVDSVEE